MSNLVPVPDASTEDEKDYNEYVGVGEAHHISPAMKRMKFTYETQDEIPDPKSVDVFANSDKGSQESDENSQNGYETPPESFPMEVDEEETPDKPGSKTIEFDQNSTITSQKLDPKSPILRPKSPTVGRKSPILSQALSPKSPILGQKFVQKSPMSTPKSVQRSPILRLKSTENSTKMGVMKSLFIEVDTVSGPDDLMMCKNVEMEELPSPPSQDRDQDPTNLKDFTKFEYSAPEDFVKEAHGDSDYSSERCSTALSFDAPIQIPSPEERRPGNRPTNRPRSRESQDGSSEDDDDVIRSMDEEMKKSGKTYDNEKMIDSDEEGPTYGEIQKDPIPNLHRQTPYVPDENLEVSDDDDDEGYGNQALSHNRAKTPEDKEDEELEHMEEGLEHFQITGTDQRAETDMVETGAESPSSDKMPGSRKRTANETMEQINSPSSSDDRDDEECELHYQQELAKNQKEFSDKKLIFQPDYSKVAGSKNFRYCHVKTMGPQTPRVPQHLQTYNQLWSREDHNHEHNPYASYSQALLRNYLNDYRSTGSCYQLFVGLIRRLMLLDEKFEHLHALDKYFFWMQNQKREQEAMEQFARVVRLAIKAEELPKQIYSVNHETQSATFSHLQCASLVARMFFNRRIKGVWNRDFSEILCSREAVCVEKLKFIFAYTDKMSTSPPDGIVSFRRSFIELKHFNDLYHNKMSNPMPKVRFMDETCIEETSLCTQIDFANKKLGGGVLRTGAVQEEIRFLMCPEMLVAMLIHPRDMLENEAISIVGAYVFSSYSGYGSTLKWQPLQARHARQNDESLRDKYGRLQTETVAIDATSYESYSRYTQFEKPHLVREIHKATVGFSNRFGDFSEIPVVSGWWGCGAFKGNKPLKFLIQVLAAGIANRPLDFCTFGDKKYGDRCQRVFQLLEENNVSLGKLFSLMNQPPEDHFHTEFGVFDRIVNHLQNQESVLNRSITSTPAK